MHHDRGVVSRLRSSNCDELPTTSESKTTGSKTTTSRYAKDGVRTFFLLDEIFRNDEKLKLYDTWRSFSRTEAFSEATFAILVVLVCLSNEWFEAEATAVLLGTAELHRMALKLLWLCERHFAKKTPELDKTLGLNTQERYCTKVVKGCLPIDLP